MRRLIVLIFLCGIFFNSFSQGIQKEVPLGTNAAKFGYLEYLPPTYPTGSSFPVIVFLAGFGERGNGITDLYKVTKYGPPYQIKIGAWPLKNPAGKYPAREFMVITPQSSNGFYSPASVHEFIDFLKSYYKVDSNSIYITGYSSGAVSIWQYLATYNDQIAAAMPMAGQANSYLNTLCTSKDIPVWAFHGDADIDINVNGSINAINTLKNCAPAGKGPHLVTVFNGVTHNCWFNTYNLRYIDHFSVDPKYDPYHVSIYDWLLSHSRGSTLQVNLGADRFITLPTNSINLTSSITSTNPIATYAWTKRSGTAATLVNANTPTLTVNGMVEGTYVFRLTVTDNKGNTTYDEVTVTVLVGAANQPPQVNAGADKTIQLPTNSAVLSGTASDQDGSIVLISWTQQSGPAATLENQNSTSLTVKNLAQGTYVFRFFAKDDDGAAAYDDVTVNVISGGENQVPLVNAGADKTVLLPTNSVVLSGTVSDPDGNIVVQRWIQQSGPSATLGDQYLINLSVTDLLEGTYVFRLFAKDDDGAAAYDDVTVTVLPGGENQAPLVNAGADKTVQLPTNTVVLSGTVSDPDGNIVVQRWNQQSGPVATLENQYSTNLTVNDLVQGTYVFRLFAKDDGGAAAYDDVTVIVESGINQPPLVNAGADRNVQLPTNSTILSGTVSDPDGSIAVHRWIKQSGPTATLGDQYLINLTVTDLIQGTYVFRLFAKDNDGAAAYDDVTVLVQATTSSNNLSAQSRTSTNSFVSTDFSSSVDELKLYPNPFKDKLTLVINSIENIHQGDQIYFRLYDLTGSLVVEKELNNKNTFDFDLPELKNGAYVFSVTSNRRVIARDRILKINAY